MPAFVDPSSGYRFYGEEQIEPARLIGLLRQLELPLTVIGELLALDGAEAAQMLTDWWDGLEAKRVERRDLLAYLQGRLRGEEPTVYDVEVRSMQERTLVSINRHVNVSETDAFFGEAFSRLRACGPGLEGIAGVPFVVFYGDVSADSDGPIELCRPVAGAASAPRSNGGIQRRVEAAHDEAFIRLALREMGWPALLPACDALERWTRENGREPIGPLRQLLIADQRTATPETLVCDLSVPLGELPARETPPQTPESLAQ